MNDIASNARALVRDYFALVEESERFLPISLGSDVPPTEVLAFVSGLLRGANIELFELGMWQSWSGLKR
jgi:hypothetical protein